MAHVLQNNYSKEILALLKKFLAPTTDFPTWGSGKGTENSRRIWLWRPVGFDYRTYRTYTGLGKQTLGGHKKPLCVPGPRRKEQWSHKRLTQTCLWVSRSLWQRRRLVVACCRVGGTECSSALMGSFEGGHHYLHYLHHSLAQGK